MIKNKLDFKLINITLIALTIFLLYQTSNLWVGLISTLFKIIFPFLVSFVIAYALYPFVKLLEKYKIPKKISIFVVFLLVAAIFSVILFMVFPLLFEQLGSLFNSIITFIKEISLEYDIDFGPLQNTLSESFNDIIKTLGKHISNGAISFIGISVNYLSILFIVIASTIYLLSDMDKIRENIKDKLKNKKKIYNYIKLLDDAMNNYLIGFMGLVIITLFEYTVAFLIIGHPNSILLGFLAAITSLIPYFGGIFTNIIAAITAFVISPALFLRTIILFLILSILDSYVINPYVYGKTNKVHPLLVIVAVFAGGKLFGILGIIASLPVMIMIITTYHYLSKDINKKIGL